MRRNTQQTKNCETMNPPHNIELIDTTSFSFFFLQYQHAKDQIQDPIGVAKIITNIV